MIPTIIAALCAVGFLAWIYRKLEQWCEIKDRDEQKKMLDRMLRDGWKS